MKPGRRALGIAESYRGTDDGASSTLGGAVVRANRVVDDFVFGSCTVGGSDATDAIIDCWRRLDRPDVRYVFLAGVALAWYNILDLDTIHEATDRPVVAVSFEDSEGLSDAIKDTFEGAEREHRLDSYRALPERRRVTVDGRDLFVRSVGIDAAEADGIVADYTYERRPEPLRVAKRAARRVDAVRGGADGGGFRRD
ncbi:DUF99 family protein [Natronomonas gomsonensis]|uniref:endonuclease dU n=1 Tax=Natronomonas gomsonensis TaxID=1046043 RepID=UPI0020CA8362|nr:DUF99 family protein [Natronomonas gomsonensis]MCY4729852.1 DUF99 family protein [Natronomonas gomsonensis]